jgi:DNA-binding XRE family transcriptional regulator
MPTAVKDREKAARTRQHQKMNNPAVLPTDTLGARVKAVRRSRSCTQKELATAIKSSQQTIVDLEKGKVIYSRFLGQIAEYLEVSLHWIETGEGSRERLGPGQSRVPVACWDYYTGDIFGDLGENHQITDWLECCPVMNSGDVVMTIVDERTAFVMAGRVLLGEWLYVDRQRKEDGLVVVVMPGWVRAELRELTTIGGRRFLASTNKDVPDRLVPVDVAVNLDDYLRLQRNPENNPPALVLGRVIFRGVPER